MFCFTLNVVIKLFKTEPENVLEYYVNLEVTSTAILCKQ